MLTFTGDRISWVGPVGPTRGKAAIYIDGHYTTTIDTYAPRFVPSRVLYSTRFSTAAPRTLRIVVLGTGRHSLVALDAFIVRSPAPGDPAPAVSPSSPPTASAQPPVT
ncbi:MAG TPA: hypothetical protein VK194_01000, partial [Candidatus Deferrimicrobium sp.]|nr:hypothetical protein [Candidatus Deferrimicrobium sp.]